MKSFFRPLASFVLFLAAFFTISGTASASQANIYIAQSSAGGNTGIDCSNAHAASFFNSSGNYGAGSTQIGPNTVVHLCGTITTSLTWQGDGTSGNPIVLDGTGATLNAAISTNGRNYWTIQNVTWATSYPNGCSIVVNIPGGGNGLIQNNTMDVHDPGPIIFLAQNSAATSLSHDIIIRNNYMRNAATTTDCQSDLIDTEGSYNISILGNYFEMRSLNNDNHDDILQTYEKGGATAGPPRDWIVGYNYMKMNTTSSNNKSFMMIEAMTGYMDMYSNVLDGFQGGDSGNGVNPNSNQASFTMRVYNNTQVQKAGGPNNMYSFQGSGTFLMTNNITYSTDAGNALIGSPTRAKNVWFGVDIPSCNGTEVCANPLFVSLAGSNYALQSGSPARGLGQNLGAAYAAYPLPGATWPNPTLGTRPASGAWDAGAYQFGSSPPAAVVSFSPTSLSFASRAVNTTSPPLPVTLSNTGTGTLNITSISISGANNTEFGQTNNCGSSVLAGSQCTINVTFSPIASLPRTANVSVADDASGSPQTVPLTGTGISAGTRGVVINGGSSIAALPSGTVGTPYSFLFPVSDGTPPYSWSQNPTIPGLVLGATTGVLSGTPATAGTYSSIFTVVDAGIIQTTASITSPLTIAVTPPPPAFVPVRINAGGPAYTDTSGNVWAADKLFSGSGATSSYSRAITPTTNQKLYQSERWGTFSYSIPAPAGTYAVTLKFAENSFATSGRRIFNVAINGATVLSNFDIAAQAGGEWKAIDKTFMIPTTGSPISIQFIRGSVDQPSVNAIEVVSSGPPPPPLVFVSVAPGNATIPLLGTVQFTATVTNASDPSVTWSANAPDGLFTSPSVSGTATVTATSVADPTKSSSALVTILPPPLGLSCSSDGSSCTTSGIESGSSWTVTLTSGGRTISQTGVKQ